MAMRFMRSMRNPSTKAGGTSNTTGSRIRSSARTIRENTVSLVQKARSKVGGAGYAHGTSSDRGLKGSAGQIKQTAANQSKKAGATPVQARQNTVAALKSAKAPSSYGLMNKAGYKVGTRVAAGAYKRNVAANNPGQRTGLESRTQLATQRASAVVSAIRGNAVNRGSNVAKAINRNANSIVSGGAKLGMRAENAASAVVNAPRAALSAASAKGKTFGQGVRMGSRMPDASLSKVYSAQRYADPKGIDKSVTRVSHATALTTAAGYGVGKAARRTVQGVNAIQDAPGNAAKAMFSTSRKVAGGLVDAAKNNRLSLGTQNALHNIVRPGIKNAVAGINRGAEKVFMGIGKGVGYAAAAPSLAVYHGGKALIGGIKDKIAASARKKVARASAMASPRMTRAAGFGQQGKTTPLGRNSVVQSVRIKNAQSGGVYMGQKKAPKPSFALGQRGAVTATGQNSVVQGVRYQNVVAGGVYKGLQRKHPKQSQPHPLRPQNTVQSKVASTGRSPYLPTTHPTRTTGGPSSRTTLFNSPPAPSRLKRTAPWESGPSGSLVATIRTNKQMSGRIRVSSVRDHAMPLPSITTKKNVLNAYTLQSDGKKYKEVKTEYYTATGITSSKMSERMSDVVGRARAATNGRPATAAGKVWSKDKLRGEKRWKATAGAEYASEKKQSVKDRFSLSPATSPGRGRPRKAKT